MKNVLTIAGHDLSSGAGIAKDLEVFSALQCHPLTIPTAFVIQGPRGVSDIHPVPRDQLHQMLRTVAEEVKLDGIKIGAACDVAQVEVVGDFLEHRRDIPTVLDPVLSAKNGHPLLSQDGLKALMERIVPHVDLVTPNTDEASILADLEIVDKETMKAAAQALRAMGIRNVLIKGGHVSGEPSDLLLDDNRVIWWEKRRINRTIHGTGCTLSSLVLAFLVHDYPLAEAFRQAEKTIEEMLKDSYQIGQEGYFYTSLTRLESRSAERWAVVSALTEAAEGLGRLAMVDLIPEVQMNVGYAVLDPKGIEDVAAFPGRIGHHQGRVVVKGGPCFGASSHVARLILAYMKRFPFMRACANVRFSREIVTLAQERGLMVVCVDRAKEPERLKEEEGKSLDFLIEEALKGALAPPDIIYDLGDKGKEPKVRLFARDPEELLHKMEMIRPWRIS